MADRYIYQVAVEALFLRAMEGRLDAGVKARLRDAGISLDEPLLSVYPADVFHRGVAIAAEAVYAGIPAADAHHRLGRDHIDAFVKSYPGKMMAALARQIEPRMIRLHRDLHPAREQLHRVARRVIGRTRSEVWMNDVGRRARAGTAASSSAGSRSRT